MLPPLLQIGDILLSTDIVSEYFACDYAVCRGRCCVEGDSGAPYNVLKGCSASGTYRDLDEVELLEKHCPEYSSRMSAEGLAAIGRDGVSTVDRDGDSVTVLVYGKECAFCSISREKCCQCAVQDIKPISCSLYPIRTKVLGSGNLALNLHRWDICKCAFEKGRREGIRVYEFLREPIIKAFGEEFYRALEYFSKEYCNPDSSSR